ncbi:TraR/DksA C4-type zinc finger protein [Salmonella enterica]|nr:conjugal transfer protein TraR [Salmonella enterica]EBQ9462904.1 conjugal transfer protein TraR [Salmonella enterica subsp. enterica serovar Wangata]MJU52010.1 conjugal transfer protein TraR [Salmonella enterica subsp. enterica serovar Coquilhatville]EAM8676695.1 conjugal transfer protein TraR [Salmonella enterica]EBR4550623.1 conjugal transfer protein TraR [Salmonella enterica]
MNADWIDEAQEETQRMVDSQVERIRSSLILPAISSAECEYCGNEIPEARRRAVPGVRLCVDCQTVAEFRQRVGHGGYDES